MFRSTYEVRFATGATLHTCKSERDALELALIEATKRNYPMIAYGCDTDPSGTYETLITVTPSGEIFHHGL